jgi:hypothetical protein
MSNIDGDVERRRAILARGHLLFAERPSNSFSIISGYDLERRFGDAVLGPYEIRLPPPKIAKATVSAAIVPKLH